MASEQSGFGVAPQRRAPDADPVVTDRSSALLSELQAVCQRILAADSRTPPGSAALTTMASVANGTAVANSLEALRRQCVDNHDQVAEMKRSVDGLRGIVAGDSAANGKILVEMRRSGEALTQAVEHDRLQRQAQMGELTRSLESLRVGLAGFSANNRQQTSELRSSVESLEGVVTGFGEQVQSALNNLGGQIQTALDTLSEQSASALRALSEQVGQEMSRQAAGNDAGRAELRQEITGAAEQTRQEMARQTAAHAATLAELRQEITGATEQTRQEMARQSAAYAAMLTEMRQEMAEQTAAHAALLAELTPQKTRDRLDEIEKMLSEGLPRFSEEIQAGVQQTLMEVSRTFRMTEREHGNRMAELHRDFDASTRRLEAALQTRRREETVS